MSEKIKAISLWQPHASAIAYRPEHAEILQEIGITAQKTIETRPMNTKYRGPILICATKSPERPGLPNGVAVATANIVDSRPMTPGDADDAQCAYVPGRWSWQLADIVAIEPFAVTGQQGFFYVDMPTEAKGQG